MPELVGVLLSPGDHLVDALRAIWDRGDGAVVLDTRLPDAALRVALDAARPGKLLTAGGEQRLPGGHELELGDALVTLTSGSTGSPRAVIHTHDAVEAAARATSARLKVEPSRDRWLACLPPSHVGGLGVLTRALHSGTPLDVLATPDPIAIEAAARSGATLVALVPTLLRRIDPTAFRVVLLGGSAPTEALPANAVLTWGMTETYGGVIYDGRPIDGVEVRCVEGELLVRAPSLGRAWRDGAPLSDDDGWLHSGDGGSVADDGTVTVAGRLAEVISTGGEMVWPAEVEAVLSLQPGVEAVAIVGRVDAEWGERVHAVVVASDVSAPPTLAALREAVGSTLPMWCAPRSMELMAGLPRTASGKVHRAALTEPDIGT